MTEYRIVAIGVSLGGFEALKCLLGGLSPEAPWPLAIVQHRSAGTDGELSGLLQRYSALPVREPEDKEASLPGTAYVAPADYHLLVEAGSFALSTEAPVLYARPSIDVLFESVAAAYGEAAIGVILTGASADGAAGLARIKQAGGLAVVQDPATAESPTLPNAALAATAVDQILPLGEVGPFLAGLCLSTPRGRRGA
jgi:two-component system, chemotaxis family, protein-glutamate methylesterase/glutaminase